MEKLHKKKCIVYKGNVPRFDKNKIYKYLRKVDRWVCKNDNNKNNYLEKKFKFKNFIKSQEFINKISKIAELQSHHPDIHFGWGYAKIKIFTHAIGGLRENDFILASKIDQI